MGNNYYIILGIRGDATEEEIKSAYRREAKKHHPDCSGEGGEAFLLVRDAYEVLSDPRRRRAHDEELARQARRATHAPDRWGPARTTRPPVEPLTPSDQAGYARGSEWAEPLSSLLEEMLWRREAARREAARRQAGYGLGEIHARVSLTRRQAFDGGRVRVWLPVRVACPACRGRGGDGFFECSYCRGAGALADERAVEVEFPGGVYDGLAGSVPLHLPGVGELSLVLHFQVVEW